MEIKAKVSWATRLPVRSSRDTDSFDTEVRASIEEVEADVKRMLELYPGNKLRVKTDRKGGV